MSSRELFTERLCLCPIEVDEVEELHGLWTDEQVRRFLWDGEIVSLERTKEIVENSKALFDERRFGIWGIRERGSSELIGFAGYWHFRTPPSLELLFGVAPSHWRRGIATESGRRLIRYAFEDLGFDTVDASTDHDNTASIRVLQKVGMLRRRAEIHDGRGTFFYRIARNPPR
jgi:RimJ/RimL family protein N-acetyltransferase